MGNGVGDFSTDLSKRGDIRLPRALADEGGIYASRR